VSRGSVLAMFTCAAVLCVHVSCCLGWATRFTNSESSLRIVRTSRVGHFCIVSGNGVLCFVNQTVVVASLNMKS